MLIDDDRDDRYFFQNALNRLSDHYAYCEAKHGAEALAQLRAAELLPDFIFLDINMPVMDGIRCLSEIKKDPKLKNIPVIIYTTSSNSKDMELTNKLGASWYLIKPWDIINLHEKIVETIKKVEEVISTQQEQLNK